MGTQYRWSPDARLVASKDSQWVLKNFANAVALRVAPEQGGILSAVAGLTIPFELPSSLEQAVSEALIRHSFVIPCGDFDQHNATTIARIANQLQKSNGFIIMPTEKCNFRCTYCYESFERGRMAPGAAESIDTLIRTTARNSEQFSLGFFGGEPLMCSDLVVRFSKIAFEEMSARNLPYFAGIATNGYYLDPSTFSNLLDVGVVSFQITIDGKRSNHDEKRATIKGSGTYDQILTNVRSMAETKDWFGCVIRCNVDACEEADDQVFDGAELSFLRNDSRFVLDIHEIWSSDRKTINSSPSCSSSFTKKLDLFAINRALENEGYNTACYSVSETILGSACYAGKPNWFVIGPDLAVYKCTVAFDHPTNKIGFVNSDGTLFIDQQKHNLWIGSNALTDAGCTACHLRVPCGGLACPISRFTQGTKACLPLKANDQLNRWAHFHA